MTTPIENLMPEIGSYLLDRVGWLQKDSWLALLMVGIVEERADKYNELRHHENARFHQINAACNHFNIRPSDYEEIKRRGK